MILGFDVPMQVFITMSGFRGGNQDILVSLVKLKSGTNNTDTCLLNIEEMWMACIFQTLTAKDMDVYYLLGACGRWSTRHLNVIPPIRQGLKGSDSAPAEACGGREAFHDLLLSPYPEICKWVKAVRDSFNDLRKSPDPVLRVCVTPIWYTPTLAEWWSSFSCCLVSKVIISSNISFVSVFGMSTSSTTRFMDPNSSNT